MKRATKDSLKLGLMALILALAFVAIPQFAAAKDNIVEWDATTATNVEGTKVDRCVGSTIECAAAGANWNTRGDVPQPATMWTDVNVPEGRSYNYRAKFYNSDQGDGPLSEVASIDVPFSQAPQVAPANFRVR